MARHVVLGGTHPSWERRLAIAISLSLHLLALIWLGSADQRMRRGMSNGGSSVSSYLAPGEFRERIFFVPAQPPPGLVLSIPDTKEKSPVPLNGRVLSVQKELEIDDGVGMIEDVDALQAPVANEVDTTPVAQTRARSDEGSESGSRTAYLNVLRAAIRKQWSYSGQVAKCKLTLYQSVGGGVRGAVVSDCELELQAQRSLEAAALMAQPLPYAGFESFYEDAVLLDVYN